MSGGELAVLPSEIAELASRMDEWRDSRQRRNEPIPECYWRLAAELAVKYGTSAVARALRLHHTTLKRHMASLETDQAAPRSPFVQFTFPAPASSERHLVEMAHPDGRRMTVLLATGGNELAALTRIFWSTGP